MSQSRIDDILEQYPDEEFVILDGLDSAVVGIDANELRLIYSVQLIIKKLVKQGLSEQDAHEWFAYNILGAHMGPKTPIYLIQY